MKKVFKVKIKADKGTIINPWELQSGNYTYPNYMPQESYGYTPPTPISDQFPVTPNNLMYIEDSSNTAPSPDRGNNYGQMGQGFGKAVGQAANIAQNVAPQLLNALIPQQSRYREPMDILRAYTRYPQGNGSQAIYKKGGTIDNVFTPLSDEEAAYYYQNNIPLPKESPIDAYKSQTRKQGNIMVTEEVPNYTSPYADYTPKPVALPQVEPLKDVTFSRTTYTDKQPAYYVPNFSNHSYGEALQILPQLPEYIDNIPVVRSPQNYRDFFQGFNPNSYSDQWVPNTFEYGGEMEAKSGIHIKPSKRGTLHTALGVPQGEKIPASKLEIHKGDSPALKKKKQFALNARKWKHENGGYIQGQEVDLSSEEIKRLLSQGYEIDIL